MRNCTNEKSYNLCVPSRFKCKPWSLTAKYDLIGLFLCKTILRVCENCKFRLLHSNFSSLFMSFTRLSVGSTDRTHGLGIIAEMIILVEECDYRCNAIFIITHYFSNSTKRIDVICTKSYI